MLNFAAKIYSVVRLSVLVAIVSTVFSLPAAAEVDLQRIYQLIDEERFEEAQVLIRETKQRLDCTTDCLAEVYFLSGYCRFRLHQNNFALEELMESVRIKPKRGISEGDYPPAFITLLERARSKALCSVEIRVLTPQSVALMANNQISTVYRAVDVPADWIEVRSNKYGNSQRFRLIPGQLNAFDLELQVLRDYHAYDSLNLVFRPISYAEGSNPWVQESAETTGNCVQIGKYCFELIPNNYETSELSQITLEGNWSASVILVLQARQEWTDLHKNLASNPSRRTLAKILKISTIVGSIATAAWAVHTDSQADDAYDSYMTQFSRVDISNSYRDYKELLDKRNILGAFALSLAATGILTYVFSPRDERGLVKSYERNFRPSGIAVDVNGDYVGLRLAVGL